MLVLVLFMVVCTWIMQLVGGSNQPGESGSVYGQTWGTLWFWCQRLLFRVVCRQLGFNVDQPGLQVSVVYSKSHVLHTYCRCISEILMLTMDKTVDQFGYEMCMCKGTEKQ